MKNILPLLPHPGRHSLVLYPTEGQGRHLSFFVPLVFRPSTFALQANCCSAQDSRVRSPFVRWQLRLLPATSHIPPPWMCTKPFDGVLLRDFKCIHPSVVQEEVFFVVLRNLAQQVPEVIAPQQVSVLMDEFTFILTRVLNYDLHERLDDTWQRVFSSECEDWTPRYPMVGKLIKAPLSLAHGNADVERGFHENRRMLHEGSKLSITSVIGLHAIRFFARWYGQDPSAVSIKPGVIMAVEGSYKRYLESLVVGNQPAAKKSKLGEEHNSRRAILSTQDKENSNCDWGISLIKSLLIRFLTYNNTFLFSFPADNP